MNNLKKVLSLVMVFAMALSLLAVAASASTFTDSDTIDSGAQEAVDMLVSLGVINGRTDGSFSPKDNIIRAHFAKMVYTLFTGSADGGAAYTTGSARFNDIASFDNGNYVGFINYMKDLSIMDGVGNGNFLPNSDVKVAEVFKVALRALGYDKNFTVAQRFVGENWQSNVIATAWDAGFYDDAFIGAASPSAPASREWVAAVFYKLLSTKMVDKNEDLTSNTFGAQRLRLYKLEGTLYANSNYGIGVSPAKAANGIKIKTASGTFELAPAAGVAAAPDDQLGFTGFVYVKLKVGKTLEAGTTLNDIEKVYNGFVADKDNTIVKIPKADITVDVSRDAVKQQATLKVIGELEGNKYIWSYTSALTYPEPSATTVLNVVNDIWDNFPYYSDYEKVKLPLITGTSTQKVQYLQAGPGQSDYPQYTTLVGSDELTSLAQESNELVTFVNIEDGPKGFIFSSIKRIVTITSVNSTKTQVVVNDNGVSKNYGATENLVVYEGIKANDLAIIAHKQDGSVVLTAVPKLTGTITGTAGSGATAPAGTRAYVVINGKRYYGSELSGSLFLTRNIASEYAQYVGKEMTYFIESEGSDRIIGCTEGSGTVTDVSNYVFVTQDARISDDTWNDNNEFKVKFINSGSGDSSSKVYGPYTVVSYGTAKTKQAVYATYAEDDFEGKIFKASYSGSNITLEEVSTATNSVKEENGALTANVSKRVTAGSKTMYAQDDTVIFMKAKKNAADATGQWAGYTYGSITKFIKNNQTTDILSVGAADVFYNTVNGNNVVRAIVVDAVADNYYLARQGSVGTRAFVTSSPALMYDGATGKHSASFELMINGVIGEYVTAEDVKINFANGDDPVEIVSGMDLGDSVDFTDVVSVTLDGNTIKAITVENDSYCVKATISSKFNNFISVYKLSAVAITTANAGSVPTDSYSVTSNTKYYGYDADTSVASTLDAPIVAAAISTFNTIPANGYNAVLTLDPEYTGRVLEVFSNTNVIDAYWD